MKSLIDKDKTIEKLIIKVDNKDKEILMKINVIIKVRNFKILTKK